MKFLLIATVSALRYGNYGNSGAGSVNSPYGTDDPTIAGVSGVNRHAETMYNITHPLPFHQHTIPQEEWDVSETNFGNTYPRNKELNAPYGYQSHDYPRNQI